MPARRQDQTLVRTNVARLRVEHSLSQLEMAELLGISLASYRKFETGDWPVAKVPLALFVNCAHIFDCPLEDVLDDENLEWIALSDKTIEAERLHDRVAYLRGRRQDRA